MLKIRSFPTNSALILLIFCCLSAQNSRAQTLIPDPNFEQALIDLNYDTVLDGSVLTANISGVPFLDLGSLNISDLTGIEDFTALFTLICNDNPLGTLNVTQNANLVVLNCNSTQISVLDVTQNPNLTFLTCASNSLTSLNLAQNPSLQSLYCNDNPIQSLDVSLHTLLSELVCSSTSISTLDVTQNINLSLLYCPNNSLSSLDLSQNLNLENLICSGNDLTSLDLAFNGSLTQLNCSDNELTCLNVKNGNNSNFQTFNAMTNPGLTCIEVDDVAWSDANWNLIDAQMYFSLDCSGICSLGLNEMGTTPKSLIRIVDFMGREMTFEKNRAMIFIYSDGTTEKVFEIE